LRPYRAADTNACRGKSSGLFAASILLPLVKTGEPCLSFVRFGYFLDTFGVYFVSKADPYLPRQGAPRGNIPRRKPLKTP
jgi:hypothetical protein